MFRSFVTNCLKENAPSRGKIKWYAVPPRTPLNSTGGSIVLRFFSSVSQRILYTPNFTYYAYERGVCPESREGLSPTVVVHLYDQFRFERTFD